MSALKRHKELTRIWASDPGWRKCFTTVSHTDLGRMFICAAFFFFAIGGLLAMLIRAQLASPNSAFMGPEGYAQVFTMHGTIMMFLFAIPLIEGIAVYLLPKLLGTRDLAYPRLTAYGFWCYILGGTMLIFALLAGIAPDGGWFMYPPLTSSAASPGINTDFWLLGITFVEISAICAAVEIIVSILRYRAPGMALSKMPIFAWYMLVVAVMILTGFPPMILGSILLELERAFGLPFFQMEAGGDSLLWQHLFWLFGHPEVYIIFLPAAGVISTILPIMSRTTLLGYGWVVAAAVALGVLSFGLWVHHMFTTGIPHMGLAFFSAASTLVAVPTAVQIFAWIGTLWKGRPRATLPMLYILAFFVTFVIGGLTGVMVAIVPFDWQVHDTHFIVAHLHYVLVGGFVFPMLGAIYYWLPHFTGRRRFFRLGETAFWLIVPAFHVTFLGVHWAGLLGQRRRTWTYESGQGWDIINLISSIGGFVMAIGFILVLIDIVTNAVVAVRGSRNPWKAGTLEWAMPTPPPAYNFASLPEITTRDPLHADPDLAVKIAKGEGYLGDWSRGRRETLVVNAATGEPVHLTVYPGNTLLPFIMAVVTAGIFLGMLLKLYWLVPIAVIGVATLVLHWVWGLGSAGEEGLLNVGRNLSLRPAAEVSDPPGWWGSIFLLLADATLFGSLIFGFAFLWTVAPNWPPQEWIEVSPLWLSLFVIGITLAPWAIRHGLKQVEKGRSARLSFSLAAIGSVILIAAALLLLTFVPDPTRHAYDATLWVIAGYVGFHATLITAMLIFLLLRNARGYLSPRKKGEVRIARLWIDYAVVTGLIGLGGASLSGILT